MDRPLAVVLVSGGMDSCVSAALARERYRTAFMHCSYGQRTAERERQAFRDLAAFYGVDMTLEVPMDHLARMGGSSLTDESIPVSAAQLSAREIPTSYVPFRNANMLAAAVSWAEVLGAAAVVIGAVEEDSSGYPDCRREFFEAFSAVIRNGTKPSTSILIDTPVIGFSKQDIVVRGRALGAPLHLTWSCYRRTDAACGTCDSCALRLRGFQLAGAEDPIPYLHRPRYAPA